MFVFSWNIPYSSHSSSSYQFLSIFQVWESSSWFLFLPSYRGWYEDRCSNFRYKFIYNEIRAPLLFSFAFLLLLLFFVLLLLKVLLFLMQFKPLLMQCPWGLHSLSPPGLPFSSSLFFPSLALKKIYLLAFVKI